MHLPNENSIYLYSGLEGILLKYEGTKELLSWNDILYLSSKTSKFIKYDPQLYHVKNKPFFIKDNEGSFHRLDLVTQVSTRENFITLGPINDMTFIKKVVNNDFPIISHLSDAPFNLDKFKTVKYLTVPEKKELQNRFLN
jgi:hypothetical protein